jgi:universal stress protein A
MQGVVDRILVPFDFSPQSEGVLGVAADLAELGGGELVVLNAIPPVTSLAGIRPPGGPVWTPPESVLAEQRGRMERIVERVLAGRRVARVRCVAVAAEPLDAILHAARAASLIVMATTGRGAMSHLLVGSVAEKVVRHAPVPVLTIGRQAAARQSRRRGTERGARVRALRSAPAGERAR